MNRFFVITHLGFLVLGWICTEAAWPQSPMREDPERLLSFANYLRDKGDLYRAEGEYLAFLSLFPEDPRAAEVWMTLGIVRREQGLFQDALEALARAHLSLMEPLASKAALEIGKTMIMEGRSLEGARMLEMLSMRTPLGEVRSESLFWAAKGWAAQRDYARAQEALAQIRPEDPGFHRAAFALKGLREGKEVLPKREPLLAGALSALLPGAGHLYVGKPWEAITSFLLNGLFTLGALYSAREGCLISAGIFSFFELGWYLGGVESAAEGARTFNEEHERKWLKELGLEVSGPKDLSLQGGPIKWAMGWTWRF